MASVSGSFYGSSSSSDLGDGEQFACNQGKRLPFPAKALKNWLNPSTNPKSSELLGRMINYLPDAYVHKILAARGNIAYSPIDFLQQTCQPAASSSEALRVQEDVDFYMQNVQGVGIVAMASGPSTLTLPNSISRPMWESMWQAKKGSYDVQFLFDDAENRGDIQLLQSLCRSFTHWVTGLVCKAASNIHAHHALQKFIIVVARNFGPALIQFVINELLEIKILLKACTDKYACRCYQRLLECCSPEQAILIGKAILFGLDDESLWRLCSSSHGNFVLQKILEMPRFTSDSGSWSTILSASLDGQGPEDQLALLHAQDQVHRVLKILGWNARAMMARGDKACYETLAQALESPKVGAEDKKALAGGIVEACDGGLHSKVTFAEDVQAPSHC